MDIVKAPAAHGLKWLVQGLVLLRRNFFIWVLFVLMLSGVALQAWLIRRKDSV